MNVSVFIDISIADAITQIFVNL